MEKLIKKTEKIIICDRCSGKGTIYEQITRNESEHTKCSKCNGSGKILKIKTISHKYV